MTDLEKYTQIDKRSPCFYGKIQPKDRLMMDVI